MAGKNKDDEEATPEPRQQRSAIVMWMEDQWEGWLKSVGTLILAAIAFALYKFDLVGEGLAGAGLVLAVIGGALGSVALPAWPMVRTPAQKYLVIFVCAIAALGAGYPSLRAAVPPKALAEVRLTTAQPSATVKVAGNGPYELTVGGSFKQAGGEAEATYTIKVNNSDEVSGSIKRSLARLRTSRHDGTTTTVIERTENLHPLPTVRGSDLTFTTEGVDDQLAEGLVVDVRPAGPNPLYFIILGVLALVGALILDARLVDQKGKTKGYFAVAVALCIVFGIDFPKGATPHSLVRPAVDSLVWALLVGALPGWIAGILARVWFGPKLKKKKA
jgi:hypothetical protein